MTVQASDNRLQPRLTNATVIINVVRGQPPFFLNTPYSTAVNERVAIGTSVYRVSAQDNDLIVSLLAIVVIKTYICDKRSWELAFYIYILICHLTGQHSVQSDWRYPRLQLFPCQLHHWNGVCCRQSPSGQHSVLSGSICVLLKNHLSLINQTIFF